MQLGSKAKESLIQTAETGPKPQEQFSAQPTQTLAPALGRPPKIPN